VSRRICAFDRGVQIVEGADLGRGPQQVDRTAGENLIKTPDYRVAGGRGAGVFMVNSLDGKFIGQCEAEPSMGPYHLASYLSLLNVLVTDRRPHSSGSAR
jgi:hypothetical protein